MTERIIDVLESVEIDDVNGELAPLAPAGGESRRDLLGKDQAVGDAVSASVRASLSRRRGVACRLPT